MSTCPHQWQKMYEEFLLGGSFPTGYQCKICNLFVSNDQIPITGLPGIDTQEKVLQGPHGLRSCTSKGESYSKQIIHTDGRLEIIK